MSDLVNLTPPQPGRSDAVWDGIKAGLGGVTGLLAALLRPPIEKRREEWMWDVASKLIQLDNKVEGFSREALAKNEVFISTFQQAATAAQRTHVAEKRAALRNAVLHAALTPNLDETKAEILVNLFKVTQIALGCETWTGVRSASLEHRWKNGAARARNSSGQANCHTPPLRSG